MESCTDGKEETLLKPYCYYLIVLEVNFYFSFAVDDSLYHYTTGRQNNHSS